MRAGVVERYGPPAVVRITTVADPVARPGEAVVRIMATTVNSGEARIRAARFPRGFAVPGRLALGIRGPRTPVLGVVFAGVVEEIGVHSGARRENGDRASAPGPAVGDRVCGMTGARMGAHAELVGVPLPRLVRIPDAVSFDDAAGVLFGGTTALHYLRDKAAVQPGERVLVVGASGAVGTNAVQLAKQLGARVTAVTSAANAGLAADLGAHAVIDYRAAPIESLEARGERFDVVFDTVGALSPKTGRPLLAKGGRLLLAVASLSEMVAAHGQVKAGTAPARAEDFATLLELVESGALRVVIDEVLPLDRLAQAHARVDSGRKVGSLVLRPQEAAATGRTD